MRSKKLGIILFSILLLFCLSFFAHVKNYVKTYEDKIYPQSFIGKIDVSGLSKDQALLRIASYSKSIYGKKIYALDGDKKFEIKYEDAGVTVDHKRLVDNAFDHGRGGSLLTKYFMIRNSGGRFQNIELSYDSKAVKNIIENIKKNVNKDPINAFISGIKDSKPIVVSEVYGKTLNENKLYQDIAANISYDSPENSVINIEVTEEKPAVTTEILKNVDTLVSTFTTHYSVAAAGRSDNIKIAANKINGKVIMPGEIFSFNKVTGARTLDNGYKVAPVIENGKLVDGIAGGVCQVSTTLYNTVIRLGIKSVERTNHTLAPAYIQPGFDATVSEVIDYKFRNTTPYPLYIEGKAKGGVLTFNIYSDKGLPKIKYKLLNEIYETIEPEIIYNSADTLPKDTVEKVQDPIRGFKVKVFLVGYEGEKEVSRELISKDHYTKVDGIYNVGA